MTNEPAYLEGLRAGLEAKNPYDVETKEFDLWERAWIRQFKRTKPFKKVEPETKSHRLQDYQPKEREPAPPLLYRYKDKSI